MGNRKYIVPLIALFAANTYAIEAYKLDVKADPLFKAKMENVLRKAEDKNVTIAPHESIARETGAGEDLVRFEVGRAWRLISDRAKANGEKVDLVDHPELLAKLKGAYADYATKARKPAPAANQPLTLGQLTELLNAGKLGLDAKETSSLIGALRVANEKRIYAKAGKNVEETDLLRSLVGGEVAALDKTSPKAKLDLPKDLTEIINKELNQLAGPEGKDVRELAAPIHPKDLKKLVFSDKLKPGALSDGQWNEVLGRARIAAATANPERFPAGMKADVVRDFAANAGKGGEYPLLGEHPDPNGPIPFPIGALPPEAPKVALPAAPAPPIARTQPAPRPNGGGGGGHPPEGEDSGGGRAIYVPPGLVEAGPATVVNIGNRQVPIQRGIDGLTSPERNALGNKMKAGGYSRFLFTRYTTTPEDKVSTCQITANHMERFPGYCSVAFSTAAHCVRDEERGGALTYFEIPEYGEIKPEQRRIFIDPKPGADYAMVVVTHPGPCKSEVPVVKLSRDAMGSRTPLLIDTRRGQLVATGVPANGTHFQYDTSDPTNGGDTTIKGDSGGGIFAKGPNGEITQVGVVSFGIVDAKNRFTGTSFGGIPDSQGTNIIDNLIAQNTHGHGGSARGAHHPEAGHVGDPAVQIPGSGQNGAAAAAQPTAKKRKGN